MDATAESNVPRHPSGLGARRLWKAWARSTTASTLAATLCSGVLVSWGFFFADTVARTEWDRVSPLGHIAAGVGLYTATGALVGLMLGVGVLLAAGLGRWAGKLHPIAELPTKLLFIALIAGGLSAKTAIWVFSRPAVQASVLHRFGPAPVVAGAALAVAAAAAVFHFAFRSVRRGRSTLPLTVAAGAILGASMLVYVDLTVFVALYAQLHTALETSAGLLAIGGLTLLFALARRSSRTAWRPVVPAALVSLAWLVLVLATPLSTALARSLEHARQEPVYIGRMIDRIQTTQFAWRGSSAGLYRTDATLGDLGDRFDLSSTARSPKWDKRPKESPSLTEQLTDLRARVSQANILVYYVDTLRDDAARDPEIMPNAVRFASSAMDFRNAYSTGSDTLSALPAMTTGSYDLRAAANNDVLTLAHQAGLRPTLVAPRSAKEYLAKELPSFRFDESILIDDYGDGERVWGYGAQRSTAASLVDSALARLEQHKGQRSLMWLFNFDVHNWHGLDKEHLRNSATRLNVPRDRPLNWQYRVAAGSVDEQFGRLLSGLDRLGLADNTIVVFVSDHGESVGRHRFWVHSTFLWECLVRVPLMIRIPGVQPRVTHDRVSLVDLGVTLARWIRPDVDETGMHGEDLLGFLSEQRPPRRLPLLMRATDADGLTRLGVIAPNSHHKLVLTLRGGSPALFDLRDPNADDRDVSDTAPGAMGGLLSELVRSPMFPR